MPSMTLTMEPLADRCRGNFLNESIQSGRLLFDTGRTEITSFRYDHAHIHVPDERGTGEYCVDIDWSRTRDFDALAVQCSCRAFARGLNCGHAWCAILKLDARRLGFQVPGIGPLDLVDDFEGVDDDSPPLVRPSPRSTETDWTQQLRRAAQSASAYTPSNPVRGTRTGKATEILYFLSLPKSLLKERLVILLYQRQKKKDGNWGKAKPWRISRSAIDVLPDPEERGLLEMLLETPEYSEYSSMTYYASSMNRVSAMVSPALAEMLLPRLCATGRFGYCRSRSDDANDLQLLTWDEGPPWTLTMRVEKDTKNPGWRITGLLSRSDQVLPLSDVRLVLSDGLILLPTSFSRLQPAEHVGWLQSLRKSGDIKVPPDDGDKLVQEVAKLPQLPPLEFHDELQWEQVSVEPRPHIRIAVNQQFRGNLLASVQFAYADTLIDLRSPASGMPDVQQKRVIKRDLARERQAVELLHTLGFRSAPNRDESDADFELASKLLPRAVRELMQRGWKVEAHGRVFRNPGEVKLSVTSGIDWFDLDGSVDFDGHSVGLPKLLAALRRGDSFVVLDDGTQGMLPEEWLGRYGLLADLGEATGDKLRFVSSQAAILDALLAAQPLAEVDERFREASNRLRSFQGIEPSQPPASFQGKLREYQLQGLGWLKFLQEFHFGGCLADDMGLGKTVQVLALLESRRVRDEGNGHVTAKKPSLAVVPRSLIFNWIEEARRFTPKLRVLNYTGLDRQQILDQFSTSDLLLTTYGTLRRDVLKFQELEFDYAILDEAQAIKNASSQSAKACRLIKADHRLAMSGTPIENHLGELWSLFEFLNPGMLGRSSTLKSLVSGKGDFGKTANGGRSLLAQALRPFLLRRTKKQVLAELPEKTEQTLYCELDDEQRKLYNELRDHFRASLDQRIREVGLQKAKIHVLEALLRLRQAACHPGLLDKARIDDSSAKLETLLEQLSEVIEEGHKALVFSQFTSLLAIVRKQMDAKGLVYEYLDGRTRDRQKRVERFQTDAACPLFLISLKAGGQGLNLTAADYVFILDPWWNPAVEAQAVDRAHRIGQERPVFAYRLIARETVEEKILELQGSKRQLADAIISEDNSVISSLTADDLQLLLS